MAIDHVYRALMPTHYMPRTGADGAFAADDDDTDANRKWVATQLPNLRVIGPLWSFGFVVDDLKGVTVPEGNVAGSRLMGFRTLQETAASEANEALGKVHRPRQLRARVVGFLQATENPTAPKEKDKVSESRLSLLAVSTFATGEMNKDGELLKVNAHSVPVLDKDKPVTPAPVVLAPYGTPFKRPDLASSSQYLPAMQLVHGMVRFNTHAKFLEKVLTRLDLGKGDHQEIVLLPDGFALHGSIGVPWQAVPVKSWFKVGFREVGDVATVAQPVIAPWYHTALPEGHAAQRNAWAWAFAGLRSLIDSAQRAEGAPRWLSLQLRDQIDAEDLAWTLTPDSTVDVLVERTKDSAFTLPGSLLTLRLADAPPAERPDAALTLTPAQFTIKGSGPKLVISGSIEGKTNVVPDKTSAQYTFRQAAKTEEIALSTDTSAQPLRLAVPMLDLAETLRLAQGLPRPQLVQPNGGEALTEDQATLWTFTPLAQGWLHWPLPNVTPAVLDLLLGKPAAPDNPPTPDPFDGISGAMIFANRPEARDHRPEQRTWTLSLVEPSRAQISEITLDTKNPRFDSATIKLVGPKLQFDGALPVVPFRQTGDRLLPDHGERALAARSVLAVSPGTLVGIERDAWNSTEQGVPRVALEFAALKIAVTKPDAPEKAFNKVSADWMNLDVQLPNSLKPPAWVWARHGPLPVVQTLPLSLAGEAARWPGEQRALWPLRPADGGLPYRFALDFGQTGLPLKTDKGSFGHGSFAFPKYGAVWPPEVGLAVTTLPSVSLYPGSPNAPGVATSGDDKSWSGLALVDAVKVHIRHDLALTDAANSLAVAPPPQDSDAVKDVADAPLGFAPRPDNGPGAGATPGVVAGLWTALDRLAAKAATDWRDMVVPDTAPKAALVGLWHDHKEVGPFRLDPQVTIADDRIARIGEWSVGSHRLLGLPDAGDHDGLSTSITVADREIAIRHGTPDPAPRPGPFVDQTGWQHDGIEESGTTPGFVRRLVQGTASTALFTLRRPLAVKDHDDLTFWCADVPARDDALGHLMSKDEVGHALRMNGSGLMANMTHGFRWRLGRAGAGTIQVQGLPFAPLAIKSCSIDGAANLTKVEIVGRLPSPARSDAAGKDGSDALATLTLTAEGAALVPVLEAKAIIWEISDPKRTSGPATMLRMPSLPVADKSAPAMLDFGLAGLAARLALTVSRTATGASVLTCTATLDQSIGIGTAPFDEAGQVKLALGQTDQVTLTLPCRLGGDAVWLTGSLQFDLCRPDHPPKATGTWRLQAQGQLLAEMSAEAVGKSFVVALTGAQMSVVASDLKGSKGPLDPYCTTAGHFWLLGSLAAKADSAGLFAGLTVAGSRMGGHLVLDRAGSAGAKLRLNILQQAPTQISFCLDGMMKVENAFSWPMLKIDPETGGFEIAGLEANPSQRIRHRADIRFDGAKVDFGPTATSCAAIVDSRLSIDEGDDISWRAFQRVAFMNAAQFRSSLSELKTPSTLTPTEIKPLDTGLSPHGPGGNIIEAPIGHLPTNPWKYTAVPHFLHASASNPGFIGRDLAALLDKALGSASGILAVDLSSHQFLRAPRSPGEPASDMVLLSLPAIAFLSAKALPWKDDKDAASYFGSLPTAPVRIAQHAVDGQAARRFPVFGKMQMTAMAARLTKALTQPPLRHSSVADAILGPPPENPPRAVFQPAILKEHAKLVWRTSELPGLGTAFQLSALLAEVKAPVRLLAATLLTAPYLESAAFLTEKELGDKTVVALKPYREDTRLLREQLIATVVPGADLAGKEAVGRNFPEHIQLLAPGRGQSFPQVVAVADVPPDTPAATLENWARATLARLAPWARIGVVLPMKGADAPPLAMTLDAPDATGTQRLPLRHAAMPPPQRQRMDSPAITDGTPVDPRVSTGFSPVAVRPAHLSSEASPAEDEDQLADPQLTSAASSVTSMLVTGHAAILAGEGQKLWLSDRQQIAFRPYARWSDSKPDALTFAYPNDYDAQLPATLVPVGEPMLPKVEEKAELAARAGIPLQSFAPQQTTRTAVGERPGAMAIWRAGLALESDTARLFASEVPLHARLPRLPRLGVKDRPRASIFEDASFLVTTEPTALVHGPVGPRPDTPGGVAQGADADAAHATRYGLVLPRSAIVRSSWDGQIVLRRRDVLGDGSAAVWRVGRVRLLAPDGRGWRGTATGMQTGFHMDFSVHRSSILALAPATALRLEVQLALDGQVGGLLRQIAFDLLTAGAGIAGEPLERPLFFNFEDPEYNARLTGPARVDRAPWPIDHTPATGEELLLAVDGERYRPGDRMTLILAARNANGGDPADKLPPDESLLLVIERLRPGTADATRLKLRDVDGSGLSAFDPAQGGHAFHATATSPPFDRAVSLDLADLVEAASGDPAALRDGDQLRLGVRPDTDEQITLSLVLDIVRDPLLPANGAAFAVLRLSAASASGPRSVHTHLHAASPAPAILEPVDPAEMLTGLVRRRALYQWRSFLAEPKDSETWLTLQKIGASGASWLPEGIGTGWQPVGK